jgi:hypothetical protein
MSRRARQRRPADESESVLSPADAFVVIGVDAAAATTG